MDILFKKNPQKVIAFSCLSPYSCFSSFLEKIKKEKNVLFAKNVEKASLEEVKNLKRIIREGREGEFVLFSFSHMEIEAQNALLKDLEELYHLFVIFFVPPSFRFLDTLSSRILFLSFKEFQEESEMKDSDLLSLFFSVDSLEESFEKISLFLKKKKNEKEIFSEVELFLNLFEKKIEKDKKFLPLLPTILELKKHLHMRGVSFKMILERFAIEFFFLKKSFSKEK